MGRHTLQDLKRSGRAAPRTFWRQMKRLGRPTTTIQHLKSPLTLEIVKDEECLSLVSQTVAKLLQEEAHLGDPRYETTASTGGSAQRQSNTTGEGTPEDSDLLEEPSKVEMHRVLQNMQAGTAMGPDRVPMSVLKKMGSKMKEALQGALGDVLHGRDVPKDWRHGRVKLIYKGTGEKTDLTNYRPITVTSTMYRVGMQVIRRRLQGWAEQKHVLGELQNGFRSGRQLEDNLYVLTQAIEIVQQEGRHLWAAFLDIEKAYDSISHSRLWWELTQIGVPGSVLELLQELYRDTTVVVEWEGMNTQPIPVTRGLRQGCPLSPLLFMLYMSRWEAELEECGRGLNLSYMENGQMVRQHLPGLFYADDLVLTAGTCEEMQQLLDICTKQGDRLGLKFSSRKCKVLKWGPTENVEGALDTPLVLQGETVQCGTEYKYLGVHLSTNRLSGQRP